MEISYDPQGRPYVSRYEIGDLVRLRVSEEGDGAMGLIGDWGIVTAVEGPMSRSFDIQIAGFSRPRTSGVSRLTGMTCRMVIPCDRRGVPLSLPRQEGIRTLDAGMTRKLGRLG